MKLSNNILNVVVAMREGAMRQRELLGLGSPNESIEGWSSSMGIA